MFLHYFALILEWIFFIGLVGSLVVAILAFVGDLHVFMEKDEDLTRDGYAHGGAAADD